MRHGCLCPGPVGSLAVFGVLQGNFEVNARRLDELQGCTRAEEGRSFAEAGARLLRTDFPFPRSAKEECPHPWRVAPSARKYAWDTHTESEDGTFGPYPPAWTAALSLQDAIPSLDDLEATASSAWPGVRRVIDSAARKRAKDPLYPGGMRRTSYGAEEFPRPLLDTASPSSRRIVLEVLVMHPSDPSRGDRFLVSSDATLLAFSKAIDCGSDGGPVASGSSGSLLAMEGVLYEYRRTEEEEETEGGEGNRGGNESHAPSTPVLGWNETLLRRAIPSGWGPLTVKPMGGQRWWHCRPSIGSHACFVHQGHCQHIVVVMDIRELSVADPHVAEESVVVLRRGTDTWRKCHTCQRRVASRWIWEAPGVDDPPWAVCASCEQRIVGSQGGTALDILPGE